MRTVEPLSGDWLALGAKTSGSGTSPFYSRVYAGYSRPQLQFLAGLIQAPSCPVDVFDPMAGQAFALSTLTWFRRDASINDINPAPLLLAWLRSGHTLSTIRQRVGEFEDWLNQVQGQIDAHHVTFQGQIPFVTTWLSESVTRQLGEYGRLAADGNKIELRAFSTTSESLLFKLAVAVLAARRISCHTRSDNRTWLKQGGLASKPQLTEAIRTELRALIASDLVATLNREPVSSKRLFGKLNVSCVDLAKDKPRLVTRRCIAVTSPPYANRLDYSVMWGPELAVLSAILPDVDRNEISLHQIGTNRVRSEDESESAMKRLPIGTQKELRAIRDSTAYASRRYYYPFFRQFACDLHEGLANAAASAPKAETWVIFIRDTVRKDVLLSAHAICEYALRDSGFVRRKADDLRIIRSHAGVMRKAHSQTSIYGFAQREWWLVFDRK